MDLFLRLLQPTKIPADGDLTHDSRSSSELADYYNSRSTRFNNRQAALTMALTFSNGTKLSELYNMLVISSVLSLKLKM